MASYHHTLTNTHQYTHKHTHTSHPTSDVYDEFYVPRHYCIEEFSTAAPMSVASVNTKRMESASSGMIHAEGGWPKDVDYQEPSDVNRYRKKVEKVRFTAAAAGEGAEGRKQTWWCMG